MRLIDAEKLQPDVYIARNNDYAISLNQITFAPTIEERPTGHWERDGFGNFFCSNCGRDTRNARYPFFCCNCGADMKGGRE
jgi:hypothetical protein